jgi:hypothetical protein
MRIDRLEEILATVLGEYRGTLQEVIDVRRALKVDHKDIERKMENLDRMEEMAASENPQRPHRRSWSQVVRKASQRDKSNRPSNPTHPVAGKNWTHSRTLQLIPPRPNSKPKRGNAFEMAWIPTQISAKAQSAPPATEAKQALLEVLHTTAGRPARKTNKKPTVAPSAKLMQRKWKGQSFDHCPKTERLTYAVGTVCDAMQLPTIHQRTLRCLRLRWAILSKTNKVGDALKGEPPASFLTRSGARWVDKTTQYVAEAKRIPTLAKAMITALEATIKEALDKYRELEGGSGPSTTHNTRRQTAGCGPG